MQEATASACAEALLSSWVSRFGVPDRITTDRGPAFLSELWSALAQLLGTTHHTTTAYNPAANGLVERFHRSLKATLMARCTAEDWTATTRQSRGFATQSASLPPCKRTYTDRSVTFAPSGLSSTTHIFVRDDAAHPPLTRPYRGPFRVLERNNKAFCLALHGKDDWVSTDRIKPALLEEETDVTAPRPPPEQSPPQPVHCRRRSQGRPRKHPPTPAASRSHAQRNPPLTSCTRGTLQRPSRYVD
ncbi:uncharacterized protein [Macrobrachium rosenbergii]|uniref:uncharacterized protein n=1 Tax=Macrobrachium rosenbergii TaxID=79674 RepID=UPI0034D61853